MTESQRKGKERVGMKGRKEGRIGSTANGEETTSRYDQQNIRRKALLSRG